jgi:PAS domain S-box-containing protein
MVGLVPSVDANRDLPVGSENEGSLRTGIWGILFNLRTFFVFVGYYLGARLGFALTFQPHPVSVMWPPNSLLLAALLLSPSRVWPVLLLAAFPAHILAEWQSGVPFRMVLCWFVSNSFEAFIGAASARILIGRSVRFDSLRNASILLLCGAFLAPFLSSFLDSAFVSLNQFGHQGYWEVWRMRLCSNTFTALTLLPVILMWGTRRTTSLRRLTPRLLLEAGVLLVGLLWVNMIVFYYQEPGPTTVPTLLYAPLPFLLWAAVRFGPIGTSTGLLSVAFSAIWGAVHGRGPFASYSPEENALSIQLFFAVISIAFTFLATSIAERGKAEERFTKAFRSSPDAIAISHLKDGQIVDVNERWEKWFGYSYHRTTGQRWLDLQIYASAADREKLIGRMSVTRGWQGLELCLRTKNNGLRHTLVSADSDDIGGEDCWIITIRDITDRKRAEQAQQGLAHASRLAIVGELTAMIAHEINQPLGAILSNADAAELLLQSSEPPLDTLREIISQIRKSDLRADETIRRIRGLLRKQEMHMQPVDLHDLIADVLRWVAGDALKRRVLIQSELAARAPMVFVDRAFLQQVLLNLIINAMDAMEDTSSPRSLITVHTRQRDGHRIEVAVRDSGQGIAPGQFPQIFESFFTTKKDGVGLGLSIARSIIEAHQGHIWAENNPDGGATFYFDLPVVKS